MKIKYSAGQIIFVVGKVLYFRCLMKMLVFELILDKAEAKIIIQAAENRNFVIKTVRNGSYYGRRLFSM